MEPSASELWLCYPSSVSNCEDSLWRWDVGVLLDLMPKVMSFLAPSDLGNASSACQVLCTMAEPHWSEAFARRWSCLFTLKRPCSSYRAAYGVRMSARRMDLVVLASSWHISGIVEDRKGRMHTEGGCSFTDGNYTMHGSAIHTRENPAAVLNGTWLGNLCACIAPNGRKRLWSLGWREKLAGYPGGYDYMGTLHEEGPLIRVEGEFSWFGKVRGRFSLVMRNTGGQVASDPVAKTNAPERPNLLLA
eukprot:TRINITY_DN19984_c0_g1_i1.p1 TRINITY_DN19984_c0_g1~~TRINITY_DN19984_c0_g1_i1.p1  ORF type:complete len:247 (+),score=29.76 TRINITY_DN19984_c0_g1_i1:67-807(+)